MYTPVILENGNIPAASPESQGIPSGAILSFLDEIKRMDIDLHAFQIVRHGKMVAEAVGSPYTENSWHRIYSAAKGIVATAVLVAVQEGYFGLYDKVLDLLPAELMPQDMDPRWDRLTVYHLLTMTDGHAHDVLRYLIGGGEHWITRFFSIKPEYEPGTFFCYDMGAQYVMNEIVKHRTGLDTGAFLKGRVFDRLGVEYTANFNECGMFFSSTIQLKQGALTRLGLLYLQEGEWQGEQLLRKDLAQLAALPHVENCWYAEGRAVPVQADGSVKPGNLAADASGEMLGVAPREDKFAGYGLHMWRNRIGGFRFSGGQGQFSVILPEYDMVFSTFAADDNPDRICDAFYDCVARRCSYMPLPESPDYRTLKARTENFNLAPEDFRTAARSENVGQNAESLNEMSAAVDSLVGNISGRTFTFDENSCGLKNVVFEFGEDKVIIRSETERGKKLHSCGLNGQWLENRGFLLLDKEDGDVSDLDLILNQDTNDTLLSGAWTAENEFSFYLRGPSMLCDYRFVCRFDDYCLNPSGRNSDRPDMIMTVKTRAHNHRKAGEAMGKHGPGNADNVFAAEL